MPVETYNELISLAGDTLARSDLEHRIADWVWLAETEAQRTLDLPMVEKRATGTTISGQGYIELPATFVEGRLIQFGTDPVVEIRMAGPSDVRAVENYAVPPSKPSTGYISGNRLYFAPAGTPQDYTLIYEAGIDHLGANNPSNYLLRVGADYLFYTALMHSAPYLGADERMPLWSSLQGRAETSMVQQAFRTRTGGGPLTIRSDGGHP